MAKDKECRTCCYAWGDRDCARHAYLHKYTSVMVDIVRGRIRNDEGTCPDYKEKVK